MKQHFIINNSQKQLLLFFAGWGMDETPFLHIQPAGCDWMICYDYRSLEFDTTLMQAYSEITLIAWSMGVWAASQIMKQHPSLPVSQSIAINGLNEQTLQKFQRRMCNSSTDYKAFQTIAPKRPVEELKEELAAIRQQCLSSVSSDFIWHKAIVGKNDRIFLPEYQETAWRNKVDSLVNVEAAHYQQELFYEVIMNIK